MRQDVIIILLVLLAGVVMLYFARKLPDTEMSNIAQVVIIIVCIGIIVVQILPLLGVG